MMYLLVAHGCHGGAVAKSGHELGQGGAGLSGKHGGGVTQIVKAQVGASSGYPGRDLGGLVEVAVGRHHLGPADQGRGQPGSPGESDHRCRIWSPRLLRPTPHRRERVVYRLLGDLRDHRPHRCWLPRRRPRRGKAGGPRHGEPGLRHQHRPADLRSANPGELTPRLRLPRHPSGRRRRSVRGLHDDRARGPCAPSLPGLHLSRTRHRLAAGRRRRAPAGAT